ncbi:MAG TPA: hypothetical protein DDW23_08250, partial [Planctomycetes bacterium]|nr:hypothetical protein [Planctomycetota bacterium]
MPLFLILITLAFGACAGPVSASNPSTASTPEDTEKSERTAKGTPPASKSKFYTEPYTPPSHRKETSIGALIVDCERHLRTWQEAMARSRTPENAETIHWTEAALATVVNRDRQKLEQEAATGPPRNRAIASAALGFAPGPRTLTFLLNNLSSEEPIVLANTLLGIGAMSDAETPLNFLADILLKEDLPQSVIVNGIFAGHRLAAKLRDAPGGHLSRLFLGYID